MKSYAVCTLIYCWVCPKCGFEGKIHGDLDSDEVECVGCGVKIELEFI